MSWRKREFFVKNRFFFNYHAPQFGKPFATLPFLGWIYHLSGDCGGGGGGARGRGGRYRCGRIGGGRSGRRVGGGRGRGRIGRGHNVSRRRRGAREPGPGRVRGGRHLRLFLFFVVSGRRVRGQRYRYPPAITRIGTASVSGTSATSTGARSAARAAPKHQPADHAE